MKGGEGARAAESGVAELRISLDAMDPMAFFNLRAMDTIE
jgi:hypothetical protein